jgi:hypothetical protein
LNVIEGVFGHVVDAPAIQKNFGSSGEPEKRFSSAKCIGCEMKSVIGTLDPKMPALHSWNCRHGACAPACDA